jgi:hypothetical protein
MVQSAVVASSFFSMIAPAIGGILKRNGNLGPHPRRLRT